MASHGCFLERGDSAHSITHPKIKLKNKLPNLPYCGHGFVRIRPLDVTENFHPKDKKCINNGAGRLFCLKFFFCFVQV